MGKRPITARDGSGDVLADIMACIRLHGALFCRAILGAPWGFTVPKRKNATFHFVASGKCTLEVDGLRNPTNLAASDLVILPHGNRHTLRDEPESPIRDLDELLSAYPLKKDCVLKHGGNGRSTVMLCGGFVIENANANLLLGSLPPVLLLPADRLKSLRWLRSALDWMISEMRDLGPGSEAVTDRLSEILFVEALRAYCADCNVADGAWVQALADPLIGPALALIHHEPETRWTVATIAQSVGISRSSFASKFERLVGEPPLQYVTRCRLGKAARLLQTSRARIPEIARLVGYSSVVAFHKAFKRFHQVAPGEFRRTATPRRRMKAHWFPDGS